ncbi:MAG: hypothetical protein GDA50_01810 [Alphaproteobacteria bacterium GM202ARS2]|nr:hypothetical protein [Alphaproteobacteria bacterium GM202ARS2]
MVKRLCACVVALLVAGCGGPSDDEVSAYHALIKEKHRLLGEAMVVHGQLLERFAVDETVLDEGLFRRGEEMVFHFMDSLGAPESIGRLPLPAESLRPLHEQFTQTVAHLSKSVRLVDEGAYTPRAVFEADLEWNKARQGYLAFTSELLTLTGREDEVLAPKEDKVPVAGEVIIAPDN